jgi:glycosyltransferase involved in cell wall biosynthesis
VVHLILAPSFFAYAPLFLALPFPVVLTLSGELRYVRHYYGPAKRAVVRFAVARADALVVCSADELENLRLVSPRHERRAVLLDNFTDTQRFRPAAAKERTVVFAARLHPEKGALLFIDAIAGAQPRLDPGVRVLLLGTGELAGAVAQRLEQHGLRQAVGRGYTTDLAPVLATSSVFVSCQQHENLGSSSLLEAMACQNAIVATDVGQTWRIVDEAVGVRTAPDPEALADGITALLDDPARLAACGAAARRRVVERYSPDPYVERLLGVYALARSRVRRPS